MPDDDLKTMVREFRSSVAADLGAQHQRLDDFNDEMRSRLVTLETAIVNEIRDLSGRLDRRVERVETHVREIDARLDSVDQRLDSVDQRLDEFLGGDRGRK